MSLTNPSRPRISVASLRLRSSRGFLLCKLYRPAAKLAASGVVLLFTSIGPELDTDTDTDPVAELLCSQHDVAVLRVPLPHSDPPDDVDVADAVSLLEWAGDHAGELAANATFLAIGGVGSGAQFASDATATAAKQGWPLVWRDAALRGNGSEDIDLDATTDPNVDGPVTKRRSSHGTRTLA